MKPIIVLEPSVANKIAAGEVVERPASIVKELMENSLDAGADSITVEIRDGGVDYIRVTDNGCGIPEADTKNAFLRHATSKLSSVEELNTIESFGFRGEALASIAAVSKVSMRTRTADADYGTRLDIAGGRLVFTEPCACPCGTSIEVNELFFNVPARLKFISNLRTEAAMITDYVSRIMLAQPNVSIKLVNQGRTMLHTYGDGDLQNAILCVYGGSVFSALYRVEYDDGYIAINGYVGGEMIARSNRLHQSVFVNKRYIKSMLVSGAVQRAFLTRLMNRKFPFFVLDITVSSREVDVNVHPNKLSVRFSDEDRVASAVTRAISEALSREPVNSFRTPAALEDAEDDTAQSKPAESASAEAGEQVAAPSQSAGMGNTAPRGGSGLEKSVRELFQKGSSEAFFGKVPSGFGELRDSGANAFPDFAAVSSEKAFSRRDSGVSREFNRTASDLVQSMSADSAKTEASAMKNDFEARGIPVYHVEKNAGAAKELPKVEQLRLEADGLTILGAAFDTYIIVQQGDAIYYIDQHAAHERMRYEKLIAGELRFDSQLLALPLELVLDPIAHDCAVRNIERLEEFGYSIEATDGKLTVTAVPNIMLSSAERFLRDAVDMLLDYSSTSEVDLIRSMLIEMSCKGAVKAGDPLDELQLKAIVDGFTGEGVPLTCPHGRPVIVRVTKTELQKMFKRIV